MGRSVQEDLDRGLDGLDVLECLYGLNDRDRAVFRLLRAADDPLAVDEVAERLDCERSTAYRSICRLRDTGVVVQKQVNYEGGGYYHVYLPADSTAAAREMQRLLNDWYARVGQLIQTFEDAASDEEHLAPPARKQ